MRLRDLPLLASSAALIVVAAATLIIALREVEPPTVIVRPSVTDFEPPQPAPSPGPGEALPPDDGFLVVPLDLNDQSGRSTFAVQRRVANPFREGEHRWTLTFYSLEPNASESNRLKLIGSRCVEYDMGPDELGMASKKGWAPEDIRQAVEKARDRQASDD